MKRLLMMTALLAAAGCGKSATDGCANYKGQTCISLEIRSPSGHKLSVDQIALHAVSGFQFSTEPFVTPSVPLSPAVSLPLVVPILPGSGFGGGDFDLGVDGLAGGASVGHADVAASVSVGAHVRLVAVLVVPSAVDGGMPDLSMQGGDGGGEPDLAIAGDLLGLDLTQGPLPDMAHTLPRPVAPVSTGFVTIAKPTFKWVLGDGTDGVTVDVCKDRACNMMVTSFSATGTSGAPAVALPSQVLFWRLHPASGGTVLDGVSPTWEFTLGTPTGTTIDTSYGNTPDFNGDGFADLAYGGITSPPSINAGFPTAGPGRAYVWLGKKTAKADWHATLPSPDFKLNDPNAALGDAFGTVAIGVGDLDGDGYADLAVGSPGANKVFLYRGGASGFSAAQPTPDQTIVAPSGTLFGRAIAGGDLDGDGYADLAIGGGGKIFGYHGGPSLFAPSPAPLFTSVGGDAANGASIANAGDVNGDGFGDMIVGDSTLSGAVANTAGVVSIALGSANAFLTIAGFQLPGIVSGDQFGAAVAGAADVNGDGFSDVLVGAPGGSNGTAYVVFGSANGISGTSTFSGVGVTGSGFGSETFGAAVAMGDVSGDGKWDILVSGPAYSPFSTDSAAGRTLSMLGPMPASNGAPQLTNSGKGDEYGSVLKFTGDIDGDGHMDVVVATPRFGFNQMNTSATYNIGKIDIYFSAGTNVSTPPDVVINGPDGPDSQFGY